MSAKAGRPCTDGVARHGVFQRCEPPRIALAFGQQAVAPRHGGVEGRDLPGMAGFKGPHQPIEEPAPARCALLEQPVHLGRQPDRSGTVDQVRAGLQRGAVQAPFAARVRPLFAHGAGRDLAGPVGRLEATPGGPWPAARGSSPADLGRLRATQAATRAEQADRFEQIGLPDAVLAGNDHDAARHTPVERGVGAEIGEAQTRELQR
ncbi:hypothetical protein J4558_23955 [Leptolyngbya sp. 15MV]|nr:hypothetical protein J4558_23955 [Leptolyngbya sp. 15MV]